MYNVNQVNQLFVVNALLEVLDMYDNTTDITVPTNNQIIWAEANDSSAVPAVYKYVTDAWVKQTTGTYALSNGTFVKYVTSAWEYIDAPKGAVTVHKTSDNEMLYFKYVGAKGMLRSDLVPLKVVLDSHDLRCKASRSTTMVDNMNYVTMTVVSDSQVIAGETYVLKVNLPHLYDIGDESIYTKYASVKATSTDTASKLNFKLAKSLWDNLDRNENKSIFKVGVIPSTASSDANIIWIDKNSEINNSVTYAGIIIEAVPQPWELGIMPQTKIDFDVAVDSVTINTEDVYDWFTITKNGVNSTVSTTASSYSSHTPDYEENGKKIADLEYFLMGERGDQYRMVGYPNYVKTDYMVDETKSYDVVAIHYSFIGHNEDNKRGEKDLTFVMDDGSSNALAKAFVAKINAVSGSTLIDTTAPENSWLA